MEKIRQSGIYITLFIILISSFSLVSCNRSAQSLNQEDTLLIGEVDSMTGNEATFGVSTNRGIVLAFDEINEKGGIHGKKLKLKNRDIQGRPDEGARAVSMLINQDKVIAVLTGVTSSHALAIAPYAQKSKVPLIATAATAPELTQLGDFIFRVCFIDPFQGEAMAKFALQSLSLHKIAILRDMKSDYSIGLANQFAHFFKAGKGEILIDQSYSGGDIDFRSQLTAIRAAKIEAIFIPGYYTDVSLIGRQARELGIQVPLLGADGWDSPKLKEIGGNSLNGSYFSNFYSPEDPSPQVQAFLERYKKAYGTTPDGSAAMGYETAMFLADALRRSPSLTPEEIRKNLASSKDIEMLSGKMSIDSKRNALKPVVVLQIDPSGKMKYFTTVNP